MDFISGFLYNCCIVLPEEKQMKKEKGKRKRNSIMRIVFVGVSLLVQIGWLLVLTLELNEYSAVISLITSILALLLVLRIHSHHTNTALKMPWIMLILAFPAMGVCLYLLVETLGHPRIVRRRLGKSRQGLTDSLVQEPGLLEELDSRDRTVANQFRYLRNSGGTPVYRGTRTDYYPEAKLAFEAMKQDLEKAESFIFMEYFILEDGESFAELRRILSRKAKAGVEVRLMYDDFGSIGTTDLKFARELSRDGIQCQVFNPAMPIINLFMNHRDHRKITVIDGKVGYTGGYNLSDEYFDITQLYGKWKDLGLRLEGEAVKNLTATFLELWNFSTGKSEDAGAYLRVRHSVPGEEGFVQPYADGPVGSERITENVYLNLINSARNSVWFMTPYLIITDEMTRALQLAAKRGVDVRIITPGIPDKKTVYRLTRSYYGGLATQGVRIYEYTPGFCHGKLCVCDGVIASIGTSNLDYRSLYLHFENNVLLYDCDAVKDMQEDMEATFELCREVTEKYRSRSVNLWIWQCVLRLFAPLL